eukprot:TRINITY_DN46037_c0_g1_i1.p1 TRINITY_DN46037_c0_g1~~TRINITY_DN46037_c0_g1_i1.p1  ORF type:complete len:349 (-),score=52.61 TRINITY_DN46037_c0_g1_i1:414-1460(-)
MAPGPVRDRACPLWHRGMDCAFDESSFWMAASYIWGLTTLVCVVKAYQCCRSPPRGLTRWCLLLTAASAACYCVDSVLHLRYGEPLMHKLQPREGHWYRDHPLVFVGSIFLGFALQLFAWLWCDVAGALSSLKADDGSSSTGRCMLLCIRWGYVAAALLNVPIAALMIWAEGDDSIGFAWGMWCFASACVAASVFAVQMWWFVRKHIRGVRGSEGLWMITVANLLEQTIYNVCLVTAGALYYPELYNESGRIQSVVMSLLLTLFWIMHAQMLLFVIIVKPCDPMYSSKALEDIMALKAADGSARPAGQHQIPSHPPSNVIGSPEIISAQPLALEPPDVFAQDLVNSRL